MYFGGSSFAASPFGDPGGVSVFVALTGKRINVSTEGQGILFSAFNDAQLSTAQKKFGTASLLLDGTNDYVESTSDVDLSSTDFTIDLWIRPTSVSGYKGIWESGTSSKLVSYLLGNTVYLSVGGSTIISNSVTPL